MLQSDSTTGHSENAISKGRQSTHRPEEHPPLKSGNPASSNTALGPNVAAISKAPKLVEAKMTSNPAMARSSQVLSLILFVPCYQDPMGFCARFGGTGVLTSITGPLAHRRQQDGLRARDQKFHGTALSPDCRSGRGRASASAAHVVLELLDELALFGQHGTGAIADGNESEDLLVLHDRE